MKEKYSDVILTQPALAATKNIDNILWKHCFYRTIEDYRKRIRMLTQEIERMQSSISLNHIISESEQNLLRLGMAYNKFLSDSMTYYQELLVAVSLFPYVTLVYSNI
jgi:hypothetical protein